MLLHDLSQCPPFLPFGRVTIRCRVTIGNRCTCMPVAVAVAAPAPALHVLAVAVAVAALFVLTVLILILTILSNASKLKELEEKVQYMEYGVAFEA